MAEISVIIPIYKVERYMDKCISSVCSQSFTDIEIILVDDGSPDNCPQMCDKWAEKDERIRVIHKKNGGLSSARNAGIRISGGKWIFFVDSDDWLETDYFDQMMRQMGTSDCDIFVTCGYIRETAKGPITRSGLQEIKSYQKNEIEFMMARALVPQIVAGGVIQLHVRLGISSIRETSLRILELSLISRFYRGKIRGSILMYFLRPQGSSKALMWVITIGSLRIRLVMALTKGVQRKTDTIGNCYMDI